VAGGANWSSGILASVELYEPASGDWAPTGSLIIPYNGHTATLLPNGNVLVAGGAYNDATTTELYESASGTWTATGNLATARVDPSTILLPNGKVLVAGGLTRTRVLKTAELYDVGLGFSGAWKPHITTFGRAGGGLQLTGSHFQGISQASGGNTQDSSSNYPIVQLRSIDNSQVTFLPVDPVRGWSDTSFASVRLNGAFPFGPALVTVFTSGIPSAAKYLVVAE
jgi:hypothetical protein